MVETLRRKVAALRRQLHKAHFIALAASPATTTTRWNHHLDVAETYRVFGEDYWIMLAWAQGFKPRLKDLSLSRSQPIFGAASSPITFSRKFLCESPTQSHQAYRFPRALQYFACLEKFNLHSSNCWKSSSTLSTACAATCGIVVYVPNLEESPAMIFCLVSSRKNWHAHRRVLKFSHRNSKVRTIQATMPPWLLAIYTLSLVSRELEMHVLLEKERVHTKWTKYD